MGVGVSVLGEMEGWRVGEILGATEGAEHEFDCRLPIAKVLGERLSTRDILSAATGLRDGAAGPHRGGKIVLHFAGAGVSAADTHPLRRRGWINVETGLHGERRHPSEVRDMNPGSAAGKRQPAARAVPHAAA